MSALEIAIDHGQFNDVEAVFGEWTDGRETDATHTHRRSERNPNVKVVRAGGNGVGCGVQERVCHTSAVRCGNL